MGIRGQGYSPKSILTGASTTNSVFENLSNGNAGAVNLDDVFPTADMIRPAPFDPRMIIELTGPASSVSIAGTRGTGKTTWAHWALRQCKDAWPYAMIVGETSKDPQWECVPDTFSLTNLDQMDAAIGMLIARQEKYKKAHAAGRVNRAALLVLDDVLGRADRLRYSHNLDRVLTIGRHMDIGVWSLLQQPTGYTPMQRSNVDWMVILRQNSMDQIDVLRKAYLGTVNGKNEQLRFLMTHARGWNSLVIGNRLPTDIGNRVFTVTAPEKIPAFKLGGTELWESHRRSKARQMGAAPLADPTKAWEPVFRQAPPTTDQVLL